MLGHRRRWWRVWVWWSYRKTRSRLIGKRIERAMRHHFAPVVWETLWEKDPLEALL